jgi:pseudouridine synthase
MTAEANMRLQKYLARAGVASRRASENIIRDGRVSINGSTVTTPGTIVDSQCDIVCLDGKALTLAIAVRTIMLNKPRGYICSANASQGRTVFELTKDIPQRLFTVGRLDKESEGLLLLTSDGELANRLTHPRYGHTKTYEVSVSGQVSEAIIQKLNSPMFIDGYRIQPVKVSQKNGAPTRNTILSFALREGRNRQIRKMCENCNLRVMRLKRIQLQDLTLNGLASGKWRDLTEGEIKRLKRTLPND